MQATPSLHSQIDECLSIPELKAAKVGILIQRLNDGEVVYSKDSDRLFIVASNNKLFVTAAALHILGADYRFETIVWTPGRITGGKVLRGDVIVRGSGDPNLSGRFHPRPTSIFESWAQDMRRLGIRRIEGGILADDHAFDREGVNPKWPRDQLSYWYCAPVSALSFNDNCIDITVRPGKRQGTPLRVSLAPPTSYVRTRVTARTGSSRTRSAVGLRREDGSNTIRIEGNYPLGAGPSKESITVDNPALYAVHVFREVLKSSGIEVSGPAQLLEGTPSEAEGSQRRLASFSSGLLETLRVTNKRSQNFYAEQLLKTLGHARKGQGTWPGGLEVVQDFLAEIGISPGTYQMVDGSGLSRDNRFSPAQMVLLLRWMYEGKHRDDFQSTLACAGKDGTVAARLNRPGLRGQVYCKTGYIRGASALSGYLYVRSGSVYAFSILLNDFQGASDRMKRLQDEICEKILAADGR